MQNVDLSNAKEWFQSVNNLPLLTSLRLGFCWLPKIVMPSYLNFSTTLAILDLFGNGLTSSSFDWLFNFSSALIKVGLSNNCLQGVIPYAFGNMISLAHLDLSSNQLEDFSQNQITGSLLDLTLCSSLRGLYLWKNQFEGTISRSIRQIPMFEVLDVNSNHLEGLVFEAHLSNLSPIVVLRLINGIMPDLSLKFPAFPAIDLSSNHFAGLIPFLPHAATSLNFSKNKFSRSLGSISKLKVLQLCNNSFTGELPLPLRNCINLIIIDLGDNRISGTIPMCLDNFLAMTQTQRFDPTSREYEYKNTLGLVKSIDLSSNKLTGEIAKIGDLKLLESLDLSTNQLSGGIPISLSNLNFLSHLDFSDNNLSGKIPSSTQLHILDNSIFVGNPKLCGATLTKVCPGDEASQNPKGPDGTYGLDNQEDEDTFITTGFYVSMGLGFTLGSAESLAA
ncbi:hypothetical protein ACSBR1_036016 [Camellia fascicularis]